MTGSLAAYATAGAGTSPEVEAEQGEEVALAPPWITILFNCDCHTFEDVVKVGPETECVRVGNILAAIGLVVTVTQS